MSREDRIVRYGVACVVIVAGVACGATITGSLGGTLATLLIGVGMLAFLGFLLRDIGLSDEPDRSRRRADASMPRPAGDRPRSDGGVGPRSDGGAGPRSDAGAGPRSDAGATLRPVGDEPPRAHVDGHRSGPRVRPMLRRPERLRGERRRLR